MTPKEAERVLRASKDPLAPASDHRKLSCQKVHMVFDEDPDGLREILYTTYDGDDAQPSRAMTAYVRAHELVSIGEGW